MLDAHSALAIPAETHFVPALLRLERPTTVGQCLDVFDSAISRNDFGFSPGELQRALPDVSSELDPADFLRIFYRTYAARHGKARWGDKTPTYLSFMTEISHAVPEVTFVHLIRDARAVTASRRPLPFGPGPSVTAQARDWQEQVRLGRQAGRALGDQYIEVRYEDLVQHPEDQLRRICGLLQLTFEPAMLSYYETAANRLGELEHRRRRDGQLVVERSERLRIHENTAEAPDPAKIEKWRTDLTAEEIGEIEDVAGVMLRELGYL